MMRRATDKLAVVCTAICILCLAGVGVWSGTVLDTNRQADQAADTAAQIQRERARNVRSNCEEQNRRHDDSIGTLDRLVLERLTHHRVAATLPAPQVEVRLAAALKLADPPVRAQVQQSIGSTVLLIEALVPKRDCRALVARQVNTK